MKNFNISGFVTSIETKYNHLNIMFLSDYEKLDNYKFSKQDFDKDLLLKKLNEQEEYFSENNIDDIKSPISKCKKYFKTKYSKYCKCYNMEKTPIDINEIIGHKVKMFVKLKPYNFQDFKTKKKIVGTSILLEKIFIVEM